MYDISHYRYVIIWLFVLSLLSVIFVYILREFYRSDIKNIYCIGVLSSWFLTQVDISLDRYFNSEVCQNLWKLSA